MFQPCCSSPVFRHCLRIDPTVTSCGNRHGRTTISTNESFWDFSNRVYRHPLTRETLLSLQNTHQLDANLLLFCCWHAHTRGRLAADIIQQALAFSHPWANQVVRPLRAARSWMKHHGPAPYGSGTGTGDMTSRHQQLRERIKALELQAEHLQEDMLESLLPACGQSPAMQERSLEDQLMDAMHNHQALLEASDIPLNGDMNELLAALITATLLPAALEESR